MTDWRYHTEAKIITRIKSYLSALVMIITSHITNADSSTLLTLQSKVLPIKSMHACVVELEQWGKRDTETEKFIGIYPEIFEEFSTRTGINLIYTLAPYQRTMLLVTIAGGCDFTISLPSEDIVNKVRVGDSIWTIKLGIVSKPGNHILRYDQLRGKNIGLLRGAAISPKFDTDTSFTKTTSVQFSNLLTMLEFDRIDAIAGDIEIINSIIDHKPSMKHIFATPLYLNDLPLHVIVSNESKYAEYFDEINERFIQMKEDGAIKKIIYKNLQVLDK